MRKLIEYTLVSANGVFEEPANLTNCPLEAGVPRPLFSPAAPASTDTTLAGNWAAPVAAYSGCQPVSTSLTAQTEKVDALGAYCRFDSHLNERLRELSLLIAARH